MPWWGWIVIGCFLLTAELLGVDAAFYLIFIGFAAVVTGLLGLVGITMPDWAQWLTFAAIALASMVLFRKRVYERFRPEAKGYDNTLIGEVVEVIDDVASGAQVRVHCRGSVWSAVNVGGESIGAGQSAEVVEAQGTLLKIKRIGATPEENQS
jgi:membrane protein implicated in regulation of membrane protease activity